MSWQFEGIMMPRKGGDFLGGSATSIMLGQTSEKKRGKQLCDCRPRIGKGEKISLSNQ